MSIKRMALAIEKGFALENQRRHPGQIVFVNAPGKLDESIPVRIIADW